MKKIYFFTFVLNLLFASLLQAQTDSKGFSFQGYALDADGKALGGTQIDVLFSIYPSGGSLPTSSDDNNYVETATLTTDAFGVFAATIGTSTDAFKKINFSAQSYKLNVQVRKHGTTGYVTISDAQLMSVPYARSASNGVPVGSIIPFGGPLTAVPEGWLPCDGASFSTTSALYKQLYAVIGNTWGGNSSAFNVPDLRGYFLRGANSGSGNDPDASSRSAKKTGGNSGDAVGSYQSDIFGSHNHTNSVSNNGSHTHDWLHGTEGDDSGSGGSYNEFTMAPGTQSSGIMSAAGEHNHTVTIDNTGGNETRPKNAYVNFIIKY